MAGADPGVYYCGVDGGGSHSVGVLMNARGEVVGRTEVGSTNYYLVGEEQCFLTLGEIVAQLRREAGLRETSRIRGISLCLSGAESSDVQSRIRAHMASKGEVVVVSSDTTGAVCTASDKGGMVLIAGSGSNCQLVSPDGSTHNCGGWGNVLGDEGSAYRISWLGIKAVFDHRDGYNLSPHDITRVETLIYKYFNMKEPKDILQHLYTKFNKGHVAGLCRELAVLAREGDPLSLSLFVTAGRELGQHVVALLPHVSPCVLSDKETGLLVVAAGGVWGSWDLLEGSFLDRIKEGRVARGKEQFQLTVVQLVTTSAVGACYAAAKQAGDRLNIDFKKNVNVLYSASV